MMPTRTPEQIRASIEINRAGLVASVQTLQGELAELRDWRSQIVRHRRQILIGAGVAGFVLGGGLAALAGRRRRRGR